MDGEVPPGWTLAPFGAVVGVRKGKVEPREATGLPYVALEHLEQGRPRLLGWSGSDVATSTKTTFKRGDVLFGKLRPNLKKAAPAPFDGVCSTDILPLFARNGLSPQFLIHLCHWPALQDHAVTTAEGTKMPRTSWRALGRFSVFLPPLGEQPKIAEVLSTADDAIEKTEAVIRQVRVVKSALMQRLLTRGIPGRHTRFKHTEVGEIPEEWEVVRLGEVAEVERGKFAHRPRNAPRFYGGPYPFVQTGDVVASGGRLRGYSQTLSEAGLSISRLFPKGTILITIAANIGETAVAQFDVAFPDSLVGIVPRNRADARYLEYFMRTQKEVLVRVATESAQKNINLHTLRPWPIALPSMEEQRFIADTLDAVDDREASERSRLGSLQSVKSALMQVLLSGEGRVKVGEEV